MLLSTLDQIADETAFDTDDLVRALIGDDRTVADVLLDDRA
jgi:hypothetical protein